MFIILMKLYFTQIIKIEIFSVKLSIFTIYEKMECPNCNRFCNLPNDTKTCARFAMPDLNGTFICNECHDILEWASCNISSNVTQKINKPITKIKQESKKSESTMLLNCPKCNKKFAGKSCTCGYKNPLYR